MFFIDDEEEQDEDAEKVFKGGDDEGEIDEVDY